MISKLIMVLLTVIGVSGIPMNVNASGLGITDIDRYPELVCTRYADQPGMESVCDWINVCDDTGEVTGAHGFCTGYSVDNPKYGPCPPGFHSTDDDESGLCYKNMGPTGCEYEDYILRPYNKGCGEIESVCREYPEQKECKITIDLTTPENKDFECELSVPDHCFEPFKPSQTLSNGTFVPATKLYCEDVNATDFRVTIRDDGRHNFDGDYDGIGCEKAFQDIRDLLWD